MIVTLIIGTRPEAIKLIPLYVELKKTKGVDVQLVSTGQHKEMLTQIFSFFNVLPDVKLEIMSVNQSLAGMTSLLLNKLDDYLTNHETDLIIVQGDTTTAFTGALAGFYHKKKVAHIEAGLRTYDKYNPFPEEINRQLVSKIADFHFSPTAISSANLEKENLTEIHQTGNTVIDALLLGQKIVTANLKYYQNLYANLLTPGKKMVLITGHRRESFGEGFQHICMAIQQLAEKHKDLIFIYPVHLNPNVKNIVNEKLGGLMNVSLIDPVGYGDMIYLMSSAYLILSDSGGIQEEAPSLGKPLLVMRETTERPEGISAGCSVLTGTSTQKIVDTFEEIFNSAEKYQRMSSIANPYGDGLASQRIVSVLMKHFSNSATS
jgi:UDP-N-acetylglucosamine 2-epimerase (non-hydrolysing)